MSTTEEYDAHSRQLLSLVDQLRAMGAQAEFDLPRITVIGKQSSGKSSIIEAISGISVPRDGGTCTRCPVECRLSAAPAPWSCRVSLRREFDSAGQRLPEVAETPFGDAVEDPALVGPLLRRAQAAVLDHAGDRDADSARPRAEGLAFSRNVVCVDVRGPELPNLSFVDLPGLVQNREEEDVKLVEELVVSSIKGNCIILVVLTVTDDIENQLAIRLARQEDPSGSRTIGVLTMLDLLPPTSLSRQHQAWVDVVEGRGHVLKHGYYCTRLPNDKERDAGISQHDARIAEAAFFAATPPWSTLADQRRLGVNSLVPVLNKLLIRNINESIPGIQAQAAAGLAACRSALRMLPPLPDKAPGAHMTILLTRLAGAVQRFVDGAPSHSALIHRIRDANAELYKLVKQTRPHFVPAVGTADVGLFAAFLARAAEGGEDLETQMAPVFLTDMREHISASVTRELPHNVPYQAKVALMASSQVTWGASINGYLDRVREALLDVLVECIKDTTKQHPLLQEMVVSFAMGLVHTHYTSCLATLERALKAEATPFTLNLRLLESRIALWLQRYTAYRCRSPPAAAPAPDSSTAKPAAQTVTLPVDPQAFFFGTPPGAAKAPGTPSFFDKPATKNTPLDSPSFFDKPAAKSTPDTSGIFGAAPAPAPAWSNNHAFANLVPPPTPPTTTFPVAGSSAAGPAFARIVAEEKQGRGGSLPLGGDGALGVALEALERAGYARLTVGDLKRLGPGDEYEMELRVMAEVQGYFEIAHERVVDAVAMKVDLDLVRAVGEDLLPFLIGKFELGTAGADARCEVYVGEDPDVVVLREELRARQARMEKVLDELRNFGMSQPSF